MPKFAQIYAFSVYFFTQSEYFFGFFITEILLFFYFNI